MKGVLALSQVLMLLTLSLPSLAQTLEARERKNQMVSRLDQMIEHVQNSHEALKTEDVALACEQISSLFSLYPEHLTDIGTKMSLFSPQVRKIRDDALQDLAQTHKLKNRCERKANYMAVDPKQMKKEVKSIFKSLKKHRRVIKKGDTDYNNSFQYRYNFTET